MDIRATGRLALCKTKAVPSSPIEPDLPLSLCNQALYQLSKLLVSLSKDLTKLQQQRERQRQRQKAIGLVSKTTTLHVQHAFLYISLPPIQSRQTANYGSC